MHSLDGKTLALIGIATLTGCAATAESASDQQGTKAIVDVVEYQAGPDWKADLPPEQQELQGHFELAAENFANSRLLANGPTLDDFHGFYIFNGADEVAVRNILNSDQGLRSPVLSEVKVESSQLFIENFGASVGERVLFVLNYNPGPAWVQGKPLFKQHAGEHLEHVGGLLQSGMLLAGGPVSDKQGRYIIAADNPGEAYKPIGDDPAVRDNLFVVQVKS